MQKLRHTIWLGGKEIPNDFAVYMQMFSELHHDWDSVLWTRYEPGPLAEYVQYAKNPAIASNFYRFETVAKHGGVYADIDFEFTKRIDDLIGDCGAFCGTFPNGDPMVGFFGASPGHPWARALVDRVPKWFGNPKKPDAYTAGDYFVEVTNQYPEVKRIPSRYINGNVGEYAIHHNARSWKWPLVQT